MNILDSFRYMCTLLSNFVDNISENLHGKSDDCKGDLTHEKVNENILICNFLDC